MALNIYTPHSSTTSQTSANKINLDVFIFFAF